VSAQLWRSTIVLERIFCIFAVACAAIALLGSPRAFADDAAQTTAAVNRGKILFLQCRACHEVTIGAPHRVGPNLHGMMNRKAGTTEGYTYSSSMVDSGLIWDVATLDRWLERPGAVVSGTTMAFAGIASAADRAALISYLTQATR